MNLIKQFTEYLRSSQEEVKKVSWPSRRDTIRYSALVIGVSVVVAAFFAGLDIGFTKLVDLGISQRGQSTPVQTTQTPVTPDVTAVTSSTTPTIDLNAQPLVTPKENGINVVPVAPPAKK